MFSDRKKWTREGMLAYCNRQIFSFICLFVCLHFWLWMHITEWIILILWSAVITGPVRLLIDLLNYFLLLFPISISVPFSTLKTLALDYLMCSLDRALWQQILRWEAACRFIRVLLWDTRGRKWGQYGTEGEAMVAAEDSAELAEALNLAWPFRVFPNWSEGHQAFDIPVPASHWPLPLEGA